MSDSQWLGAFIEGGYYLKINKFIDADPGLQAIFKDLHPAVKASYSTYPYKSDQLLRLPADAGPRHHLLSQGRLLRRGPSRRISRRSTTTSCPARPRRWTTIDWDQFRDYRRVLPAQEGRQAGRQDRSTTTSTASPSRPARATTSYDMQINGFIWQHGGDIWDETKAPNGHAEAS